MAKIILATTGIFAFLCIIGHILQGESNIDSVALNAPWIILVLCAGFYGIIEAIEKKGNKK